MSKGLLKIKNLNVGFNTERGFVPTVSKVSLSIRRGETFALVGESGSGKSMTALSVMQLLPTAAEVDLKSQILLEGQDLLGLSEVAMRRVRGRRVGMIFQEAMMALNPVLTVGDQIGEVLRCHFRLSKLHQRKRTLGLLEEVGIPDPVYCAQSYSHQLSGGMQQRAMIAMALAGEPDLLIADEPTTALDVTIQAQVLTLLRDIQAKTQMSLLFITHDLAVVSNIADTVAVMKDGKIVEKAEKTKLYQNPQHPYSKALLAALPDWKKHRKKKEKDEASPEPLIKVKDLKIHFPIRKGLLKRVVGYVKAVDGVSFELPKGRTLALVGESGSGKTTTGKGILRLLEATAGDVRFDHTNLANHSVSAMQTLRRKLQIIFQDPYSSMNPRMIVGDIIEEGLLAQGVGGKKLERQQLIDELLVKVGLTPECKTRYPHEFSGGQKQRICIARALALKPELIVCDEPTSALDATAQTQVLTLLQSLQEEFGLSYLLITHNFTVVTFLAHEVAVMYRGKIVEQGPTYDVLRKPQHPYTKKLLASVPKHPTKANTSTSRRRSGKENSKSPSLRRRRSDSRVRGNDVEVSSKRDS